MGWHGRSRQYGKYFQKYNIKEPEIAKKLLNLLDEYSLFDKSKFFSLQVAQDSLEHLAFNMIKGVNYPKYKAELIESNKADKADSDIVHGLKNSFSNTGLIKKLDDYINRRLNIPADPGIYGTVKPVDGTVLFDRRAVVDMMRNHFKFDYSTNYFKHYKSFLPNG